MAPKVVHTSHAGKGIPKARGSKMKGNVPRSDGLKSSGRIKSPNRSAKKSAGGAASFQQGGDLAGPGKGSTRTNKGKNNLTGRGFQGMRG